MLGAEEIGNLLLIFVQKVKVKRKTKLPTTELDLFSTDETHLSFKIKTQRISGRFLQLFLKGKKRDRDPLCSARWKGPCAIQSIKLFSIKQKTHSFTGNLLFRN